MILPVLHYPDSRLRTKAKTVKVVDSTIKTLIKNMFATMYKKGGIGLAATQVNQHLRVIVIDVPEQPQAYQTLLDERDNQQTQRQHGNQLCFINPIIKQKSDNKTQTDEGCLSVPNFRSEIERAEVIKVQALNQKGEPFTLEASGLLSVCIQHEIDHLNGILFVDYLSKLKQKRLLGKIKKTQN